MTVQSYETGRVLDGAGHGVKVRPKDKTPGQQVSKKQLLYSLDCLIEAVEAYKPFLSIKRLVYPPKE